ncbi:hypothetical protein [Orientia tsutsugamushi]|uniref:Uncharacterized protein n=1 Tax=Orientia tsutsugamushi TaxID=784 RepID=A0A2U3QP50_ORITS|nr:hypothetical protein [Orientia tsutsugamushi]KJV80683.1 hypothetical protein OTSUT76_1970 [Orientia tsutsugamushi str. UT76]QES96168.1 hypothetical protein F0363_05465 [Orientia tsutsugamushi]SPR02718.1 Uncharacterised protein [Orientia tsutsugamushi]
MSGNKNLLAVDAAKFTLKNSGKYFYFKSNKSDEDNHMFIIGNSGNSIHTKLDLETYNMFKAMLNNDDCMDLETFEIFSIRKNITANNEDISTNNLVNTLTFFSKILPDISNISLHKEVITNVIKYIIELRGVRSDVVLDTLINEICENINLDKNILSLEFEDNHFGENNAGCGVLVEKNKQTVTNIDSQNLKTATYDESNADFDSISVMTGENECLVTKSSM